MSARDDAAGSATAAPRLPDAGVDTVRSVEGVRAKVLRRGVATAAAAAPVPRTTGAATPPEESEPEPPSSWLLRPGCRPGLPAGADGPAETEESDDDDPEDDEPDEPVRSANAIGIAATADPTPNATARAPMRPTYRAPADAAVRSRPPRDRENSAEAIGKSLR